jgi:HSP20 family protein
LAEATRWATHERIGGAKWKPNRIHRRTRAGAAVTAREDKFIIRAELPGVSKEDVSVDVSDDAITIHGERKHEQEQEQEGFYHSEWSYGSFSRTLPLPEGAIVDNAEASFRDGVLKVTLPAPPHGVRQGRRMPSARRPEAEP